MGSNGWFARDEVTPAEGQHVITININASSFQPSLVRYRGGEYRDSQGNTYSGTHWYPIPPLYRDPAEVQAEALAKLDRETKEAAAILQALRLRRESLGGER